jgi:WD40 repeat protein
LLGALNIVSSARQDAEVEKLRRLIWQRFRNLDLRPTTFLEGHIEAVQGIDVSFDGRLAATSAGYWQIGLGAVRSQDDTVRLWDLHETRQLAVFEGHKSAVLRVRFNVKATAIVSASQDGNIKIWDIPSRSLRCEISLGQFEMNPESVDFSSDGDTVFAVPAIGRDKNVGPVWSWSASNCTKVDPPIAASPETMIVSWAYNRMWTERFPSETKLAEWFPAAALSPSPSGYTDWHAAISPVEPLVAVALESDHVSDSDYSVLLFDGNSGKLVRQLIGHKNGVHAVAFTPMGCV